MLMIWPAYEAWVRLLDGFVAALRGDDKDDRRGL